MKQNNVFNILIKTEISGYVLFFKWNYGKYVLKQYFPWLYLMASSVTQAINRIHVLNVVHTECILWVLTMINEKKTRGPWWPWGRSPVYRPPNPQRCRANFNPRAFICTNLVDTHKKMFHAKHLSSSSFGFLKEDFF
jgi:hypothetical protein